MFFDSILLGVLQKKYIQIKRFKFEKNEVNSSKMLMVVTIFHCLHLEVFTNYLGALLNYNLISNCCHFLMAFR